MSNKSTGRLKLAGMIGAGVLAGAAIAATGVASAATSGTSTTAPSTSSSTTQQAPPQGGRGGGTMHGSAAVRSDEKVVTGTTADKLKAAALKAVPGGTVYRVETDAGDGAYEVHMTKSGGTEVTVKFDKNLAVIGVEDGMGKGDPAPAGVPSGAQPGSTSGTTTG